MIARLNSAVLRAAFAVNDRINASRFRSALPWRLAKFVGLRAVNLYRALWSSPSGMLLDVDGSRMRLPAKYVEWYTVRGYEVQTFELFKRCLKPGDTVVDAGAHVGSYALTAARLVGPSGAVFAFEPGPENYRILVENVRLNGYANVAARNAAVGAKTEKRSFNIADSSDSNSFYAHPLAGLKSTHEVDCVAIDDALAGRRVDVVKIDVEGAEPEVLQGMEKTIRANPGIVLFVEFNPCCLRLGGHDPRAMLKLLEDWGFSMTLYNERAGTAQAYGSGCEIPLDDALFHANLHCVRERRA